MGLVDASGYEIKNPNDPMAKVLSDTRAPDALTPQEWEDIRGKIRKSFIKLIVHFPQLGSMAAMMGEHHIYVMDPQTDVGPGRQFRTMATDGRCLYMWPQFVLYHSVKELMAVLLHELYHNIFYHLDRGLGYDPLLANVAMDITVNNHVNDGIMEKHNKPGKELTPDMYDTVEYYIATDRGYAVDHSMRDDKGNPLIWEEVYHRLLSKLSPKLQQAIAQGYKLTPKDCPGLGRPIEDHNPWKVGNRPANDKGEVNIEPFNRKRPEQWALDAAARITDKSMGYMPSGMKRIINELINPPIPWYRLLSNYFDLVAGDISWVPGDLRMDEPMMWVTQVHDMKWIVNTFDTSGSMSDVEIAGCINQAKSQISGFPNMKGRLFFWDAAVHDRQDIDEWREGVPREVHGGGGTSLLPQFAAMEEEELIDKTKVVCIFTDGYVDWDAFNARIVPKLTSREYPFDVIFVFTNQSVDAPEHPNIIQTRLNVDDHY